MLAYRIQNIYYYISIVLHLDKEVTIPVKIKLDENKDFIYWVHQGISTSVDNRHEQIFIEWVHEWTQEFLWLIVLLYDVLKG